MKIHKTEEVSEEISTVEMEEVDHNVNKEIEKKLKTRGHPIRIFGETDRQRMARLKLLELREEELSGGQRNDFYELLEKENGEEAEADESETISSTNTNGNSNANGSGKRIKTETEQDVEIELKGIKEISDKIDRTILIKDRTKARQLVELFFKTLLLEWQQDLEKRSDEIKRSTPGRLASATFQQTKDYLGPFFRLLKRDEVAADILSHVIDIVGFLQQGEYVRANDTYLRLSIGNAPWPIGVTMVGIHERSAHEKINSGTVAHALNDEVTRKWIQSIKRLMTFCQKVHPPTNASKAMG